LFVDDMEIVEEPFRSRRDRLLRARGPNDLAIGFFENGGIFVEPRSQPAPRPSRWRDALRLRQTLGMLFETLDAEQFRADRRLRCTGRDPGAQETAQP